MKVYGIGVVDEIVLAIAGLLPSQSTHNILYPVISPFCKSSRGGLKLNVTSPATRLTVMSLGGPSGSVVLKHLQY